MNAGASLRGSSFPGASRTAAALPRSPACVRCGPRRSRELVRLPCPGASWPSSLPMRRPSVQQKTQETAKKTRPVKSISTSGVDIQSISFDPQTPRLWLVNHSGVSAHCPTFRLLVKSDVSNVSRALDPAILSAAIFHRFRSRDEFNRISRDHPLGSRKCV